ncbi:MAG: hypothetical protein ACR2ND_11635 [Solirubrobacteraceae bacterium]
MYDRHVKRQVKTKRMATAEAARNARTDLMAQLERGEARRGGNLRLAEARENFVRSAREGKALNKRGHRYKPRSIDDIEEVLRVHVEPALGGGCRAKACYPDGLRESAHASELHCV